MAALQKIRSKGGLLIGAIGLALFAFIAEEFFRAIETSSNISKQQVGKVYGETLSVQDYQQMVEDMSNLYKIQKAMQGQGNTLTDQENEQIREQVWEDFVSSTIIAREAGKAGLCVTDADVQQALKEGTAQSLRPMAAIFGGQDGRFNVEALKDFLKNFDQQIAAAQQQGAGEYVEQMQQIRQAWTYTEKQLRKELLQGKFYALVSVCNISNPVSAKYQFEARNENATAEVVALPYSDIDDSRVTIEDADLKAAYDARKEMFRTMGKTVDARILDVEVRASAADRAALQKEVAAAQQALASTDDATAVVAASKSVFAYSNVPMTKKAFERMNDVASALDSMAVGEVKTAYYNAADNTISTFKLISKIQAPDSVLIRQIWAPAADAAASKTLADSIATALDGGAAFKQLAEKYQQPGDSLWLTSAQMEGAGIPEDQAKIIRTYNTLAAGGRQVVETAQGSVVVEVLDRKAMTTKYNVAIVKCPLEFSKETYNSELNKLNVFLSKNRTLDELEKNAGKAGYIVRPANTANSSTLNLYALIGGSAAKDATRWIFDEAKDGEISKLYECGPHNDHLLVVGVAASYKKGYLPWDDASVKEYLTQLVRQQKKGELMMQKAAGVKSTADARKIEGAVADTLNSVNLFSYPSLTQIGMSEPRLAGAVAKTAVGKTTMPVQGAGAVYVAKVLNKNKGSETFDAAREMRAASQQNFRNIYAQNFYGPGTPILVNAIRMKSANVEDNRYKF